MMEKERKVYSVNRPSSFGNTERLFFLNLHSTLDPRHSLLKE